MNVLKLVSTAVLMGSLLGSAAYAAPRGESFKGRGPVKIAPAHKAKKKKANRKMAHSKKSVRPRIGRPGTVLAKQ